MRPYLRVQNVYEARIDVSDVKSMNFTPAEFETFALRSGDILLNEGQSHKLVGRPAIYRGEVPGACFQNTLLRYRNRQFIWAEYALVVFRAYMRNGRFQQISKQTTNIAHLSASRFAALEFPIPPLAEQKRIVAKVDELMALCDRLEAQQRERDTQQAALARASLARFADAPTPANLEFIFHKSYSVSPVELRKMILMLAMQGRLASPEPNDESADEMLVRILHEQRTLKRTTATSLRVRELSEHLGYEVPDYWRWQILDDLLVFGPTNGISPKAVEYQTPVRSLTLSATTSGRFKPEHSKFIPNEIPPDSELWLSDGDILVQRGNTIEYVGVPAVYHGEVHRFVYPDLMMKLRVSSEVEVDFIHLAMSSEPCRAFLQARASGTSGSMPKINQTTLKSLPVPIPPLAEQRRIVAKVAQLMALVDQLEAQMAASREAAEKLMEAVVAELTAAA